MYYLHPSSNNFHKSLHVSKIGYKYNWDMALHPDYWKWYFCEDFHGRTTPIWHACKLKILICKKNEILWWCAATGFIKTTDHRPTDPQTTYHLPINPSTTYPPIHRPPIMNLHQNRPDSKHVLYFKVLENFRNRLFPE